MVSKSKIAVVIPAFKVKKMISKVIEEIPEMVTDIIVVDDKCPQESGKQAESTTVKPGQQLHVVFHKKNKGVGGARF